MVKTKKNICRPISPNHKSWSVTCGWVISSPFLFGHQCGRGEISPPITLTLAIFFQHIPCNSTKFNESQPAALGHKSDAERETPTSRMTHTSCIFACNFLPFCSQRVRNYFVNNARERVCTARLNFHIIPPRNKFLMRSTSCGLNESFREYLRDAEQGSLWTVLGLMMLMPGSLANYGQRGWIFNSGGCNAKYLSEILTYDVKHFHQAYLL
jgi:hypothetical protein